MVVIPMRLAFIIDRPGETLPMGSTNTHGDAGWTVFRCRDELHRLQVMSDYPSARMPCWRKWEHAP